MNQPTEAQMAQLTMDLLKTASIPMGQLEIGVAVHNWLRSKMQPVAVDQTPEAVDEQAS